MHEQGSEEWLRERAGKITASMLVNVLMDKKNAGYQNYLAQLVCERLTGEPVESYTSPAMQNGKDTEARARAFYELETGNTVAEVGFVPHPGIPNSGASPDGLIGLDGGLELKCPQPAKHIKNLMGGDIDRPYVLQMQWNMECSGREWWDYASFCPVFPPELQIIIRRVPRDQAMIDEVRSAVSAFDADVTANVAQLSAMMLGKVA